MAIKTFYLINNAYSNPPPYFAITQESAPAAGATTVGWAVGNISLATPYWKCKAAGGKVTSALAQATSNIDGLTSPFQGTSGINTGDSFVTSNSVNGIFAAGNWTLNFGLRSSIDTGVSTQAGRIRCRVWAAKNPDLTGIRELTSGALIGSTITLVSTGTTYTSQIMWNAPALNIYDEYLFFQIEWQATAVGPTGSDVVFYTSASVMQTTDLSGVGNHILNADPHLYRMCGPSNTSTATTGEVLHMDGQEGGTAFLAFPGFYPVSSFNQPRVWTSYGGITTTADSKFGGTSLYLNGSSWIESPATAPLLGDARFTPTYGFQFKVKGGDGTLRYLMGVANTSGLNNTFMVYLDANNKLKWEVKPPTGNTQIVTSINAFPVSENAWHYVSIGQLKSLSDPDYYLNMYIDGVQQATPTMYSGRPNIPPPVGKFSIGRLGELNSNYFIGYIDEWWYFPSSQSEYSSSGFGRLVPIWDFPLTKLVRAKTFVADQGSYSLIGKDATFKSVYRLLAAKGDYTLIRNAADLDFGRRVIAVKGNYQYDGVYGNDQYTRILHHMDGANTGTVFTDSATPTRTWTVVATTTSTVQSKFGGTAGSFNGAGEIYVNAIVPSYNPGSNDWTIDCWAYPTVAQGTYIFTGGSDASGTAATRTIELIVSGTNNQVYLNAFVGGTVYQIFSPTGIGINSWHHLEGSRNGNTLRLFVDGILVTSTAITGSVNNQPSYVWMIGALHNIGGYYSGYIDEARYSLGIARHTANFTPPVFPYGLQTFITGKSLIANQGSFSLSGKDTIGKTAYRCLAAKGNYSLTGGVGLANRLVLAAKGTYGYDGIYGNDQYTKILLHMDGANNGTIFTDSCAGAPAHSWISVGAVANTTTIQSKWGTAGNFNGTTAHVYTPAIGNLNPGSGDFTVDCWVYPTTNTVFKSIFTGGCDASGTYPSRTIELFIDATANNQVYFNAFVGGAVHATAASPATSIGTGAWHHIEANRNGTNLRLFIDGNLVANSTTIGTGILNNGSGNYIVGALQNYGYYYSGYMDELRYSVGIARHTTNFTPTAAPYGFHNFITGKSLIANQGSYALAGQAATPKIGYRSLEAKGDYTLVRNAQTLAFGHQVIAANGTYGVIGKVNIIRTGKSLIANQGSYSLSGKDATPRTAYRSLEAKGDYTLIRNAQTLAFGHQVIAVQGTYSYIPTDGNDQYTMSLLHMEGANGAQVFIDSAGSVPRIWTAVNAQTRTTDNKFGNSSYFSGGTGQSITAPISSDFSVGNGDFTVDLWFNPNAGNGTNRFLCGASDGSGTVTSRTTELNLRTTNVMWGLVYVGSTQYQIQGTTTFLAASNVWHHAEFSREGGTLRLFIDGILEASNNSIGTTSVNNAGTKFAWGNLGITANGYLGYLDEVRFSKGICRHNSNFTPPALPYGTPVTFITGKSLIAGQGSYSLSGQDVTFKRTKYRAFQDIGTYSITGNVHTLQYGRRVLAANSAYSVIGNTQALRCGRQFNAASRTFTLTGNDITIKFVSRYVDIGSYTFTGQNASLRYGYRVTGNGAYSTSGKNVTFLRKSVLAATKGTYAVTGRAATIAAKRIFLSSLGNYSWTVKNAKASYGLNSQKGIFSLTGNANILRTSIKLYANYSSFTLTGNPQTIRSIRKLYAAQGTYSFSGRFAAFKASRRLYGIYKLFTVIGQTATLQSSYRCIAAKNNFVLTGKTAALRLDRRLIISGGTYISDGKSLILRVKHTVYPNQGTYTQTGFITLRKIMLMAVRGNYTFTGQAITLRRQSYLNAAFAPYNLTKNNNFFKARRTIYLTKGTYSQTGNSTTPKLFYRALVNKGNYTLTGMALGQVSHYRVLANKGNYSLVSTVSLRATHKLYADKGNYIFSGKAASMVVPFRVYPDRGNFTLTGKVAGLAKRSRLPALYSTFVLNGKSIVLREAHRHPIGQGTFSLAGKVAALRRDYHYGILGNYNLLGKPVSFLRKYVMKISLGMYRIDKPDTLLVKGSAFPGGYGVVGTPVTFIRSHKRVKAKAALVSGKPVAAAKQTIPIKRYAKLIDY